MSRSSAGNSASTGSSQTPLHGIGRPSAPSRRRRTYRTSTASRNGRATTTRGEAVRPRPLLAIVRPNPEARFLTFASYDDYTTNLPPADFDDADVLLAHAWQGEPIPREHGGPVRAVVPKLYFWKSAKWI